MLRDVFNGNLGNVPDEPRLREVGSVGHLAVLVPIGRKHAMTSLLLECAMESTYPAEEINEAM